MLRKLAIAAMLIGGASLAGAEEVRFNFTFAQEDGPATATGYIVLETDEIGNPGDEINYSIPGPAVIDLSVTVSGTEAGNGTFGLDDFCSIAFYTNGGTLDFSRELVGQPTEGDPWGTPSEGSGGDFNLFACSEISRADGDYSQPDGLPATTVPNGVWYFTLGANGGEGEAMLLVTMAPAGDGGPTGPELSRFTAVPAGNVWTLAGLFALLAGAGMVFMRTRRH